MYPFALLVTLLTLLLGLTSGSAQAAPRILQFTPQGQARDVRQVQVRFGEAMVAFGNPRLADPFINDLPMAGAGRWVDERTWVYELDQPLPSGLRATFKLRGETRSLNGSRLIGPTTFSFTTGGPAILRSLPGEGEEDIDEEQVFVLLLDGPVQEESLAERVWLEVEGIGERLAVDIIRGEDRARQLSREMRQERPWFFVDNNSTADDRLLLLRSGRRLPANVEVRLVWGSGVSSPAGVATDSDQVLQFRTRSPFTASLQCTRVNAQARCVPFLPVELRFSAPVPVQQARAIRLLDSSGKEYPPGEDDNPLSPVVESVNFPGPFPEKTPLRLELPPALRDDAGRRLENAGAFPMTTATDEYPPLLKFSGDFGILELNEGGILPVTLRNLEAQAGNRRATAARGGEKALSGRMLRVTQDRDILTWLKKVREAGRERYEDNPSAEEHSPPRTLTGTTSVFGPADRAVALSIPRSGDARDFEVVGIPLAEPGLHVVELASPRLGAALLGENRPRYVATAALVTNMAVHFKWGRESSLAWVTALDSAQPVAEAEVRISDACTGIELWRGKTSADGTARLTAGHLPQPTDSRECSRWNKLHPLLVSARSGKDLSFTLTGWNEGIQPYNFHLIQGSERQARVAHTVFDRTLLQAGETVFMKHYLRLRTSTGFAAVTGNRPDRVSIRHRGTGERYVGRLSFGADGIAESHWEIPREARLGEYEVELLQGETWWAACGVLHVEQFRIPTMKGVLQPLQRHLVGARDASFDLYVAYLNGGGVSRLPVTLRTQIQPRQVSMSGHPGFFFGGQDVHEGIEAEDDEEQATQDRSPVQEQPLILDAAGAARATVHGLPPVAEPRELLAELEFQDANGERGTVAQRIPLWPAGVVLGLKPENWVAGNDRLRFQVLALDLAGKPLADQAVRVDLLHGATSSYRKRMVGGFYAYEHRTERRRLELNCSGRTAADGRLQCDLAPGVSGSIILRASTTDDQGRQAFTTREVWLAGDEEWWSRHGAGDRMDLLPEQPAYEPGEKARLQVRMPFRESTALVTVEREGVLDAFVTRLSGKEPVVEVPLQPGYAPNVYVSVLALRPRLAEPFGAWWRNLRDQGPVASADHPVSATVDLNKPAYRLGLAAIDVGWTANRLEVSLETDREVYQVRDQARVRITARRADGGPLPAEAEIAFAAVDEGLLELKANDSWKLLEQMMGRRGIEVRTATAQMQVVGKRHYGRKALPHGGGGGRGSARELFDTLLLWRGRIALDAQGQAEVIIPLNDSLSAFRLVAVAHAGNELFGTGQTSIRTSRDLMLHAALAAVVREGDRYQARVTLRNASTRTLEASVKARVHPIAASGTVHTEISTRPDSQPAAVPKALHSPRELASQRLSLMPGEARQLTWDMEPPDKTEKLDWLFSASCRNDPASDELRVTQRVLSAVPERVWQSTLVRIDRPVSLQVERPAGALPERGGIRVALRGRLGDSLGGVRDYMQRYPYSCLEQRISKAVALRDHGQWLAVLRELPAHTDREGLLRYFAVDNLPGSDVLSAYVLAIAHEAGWELPSELRDNILTGLEKFVSGKLQRRSQVASADLALRKLAAIEALSRYGRAKPDMLEALTISPQLWPSSTLLDWCAILQRTPAIAQAHHKLREAEQLLRARLNLQGTQLAFSTEKADGLWWLMVSPDQNGARWILHLLEQGEDRQRELPRLVTGLVGRQHKGHWRTTTANAWGTLALEKFSAAHEATPVTGITSASLNWQRKDMDWHEATPRPALEFPWPDENEALELEHQGTGAPWATIQSRAAIPLLDPVAAGYRLSRTLVPVVQRLPDRWSPGDIVQVRIGVEASSDMNWVVIDDPVPAGATIIGSGPGRESRMLLAGQTVEDTLSPTWLERRFEAFRAYYASMPAGHWTLAYNLRCTTPGLFQLPPTRVEAMYAPEMFGEIPNLPLEIVKESETASPVRGPQ